jgi:hypothetical protein
MAEDPDRVDEEEFAGWLSPAKALVILEDVGRGAAIREVIRRAKVGLVRGAGHASWQSGEQKYSVTRLRVKDGWWERAGNLTVWHDDFWRSGGMTVYLPNQTSSYGYGGRDIEWFGVCFEPAGIYAIPGARQLAPVPVLSPAITAPEAAAHTEKVAKSTVSEATLQAWWTFYRAVRPATEQTEDDALAHFAQCLPDKSVARVRIRKLRGEQKRGPKPRSAE